MPWIVCPNCQGERRTTSIDVECDPEAKMSGIVQCLCCGHELPITINCGHIEKLDTSLPAMQSDRLKGSVPDDIKEDIQEAERCNYYQCYKGCVTMCRRALQLGLIERGIADGPLGVMLTHAKGTLLSQKIYDLATTIKGYGDIGAHRNEELEPEEVSMVIYAAVRMLNELFSRKP